MTISDNHLFKFPDGFLWGAATSHFQIEGHPHEFAHKASDWAEWSAIEGKIADNSSPDKACEFFHRYEEDIELCKKLNLSAFRLSLNWPALCPKNPAETDGKLQFSEETVAYYRKLLSSLKDSGIKTFVTLFHFTLPKWLSARGGWLDPKSGEEFAQFAAEASKNFSDLVDYWITLNEPLAYVYQSYVTGSWPPGEKGNYLNAFICIRHMLEGHAGAYAALHEHNSNANVGFSMHWRPFVAKRRWNPLDQMVKYYRDFVFNQLFPLAVERGTLEFPYPVCNNPEIKKISGPIPNLAGAMDYLAVNYYTRDLSKFTWRWPIDLFGITSSESELETNCMGWENYPDGLYYLLSYDLVPFRFKADGTLREIFITENGFPTEFAADLSDGDWSIADDVRIQFLRSHLMALYHAIEDGANVKGYLYWSLLDNFEWSEGLRPRFGLVRIAYPTQERRFRNSALVYADIAKRNGVPYAGFA